MLWISLIGIVLFLLYWKFDSNKHISKETSKEKSELEGVLSQMILRGNKKCIVGSYDVAVAIADKVLKVDPNNLGALQLRAHALGALNFYLDSIEDYERSILISGDDANIYGLLGLTYRKIGEFEKAQANLKISVQMGLGDYKMAYEVFEKLSERTKEVMKAKACDPVNFIRRDSTAFLDDYMNVEDVEYYKSLENSLHCLQSSVALNPNNASVKNLYEMARKDLNMFKEQKIKHT